MSEAQQAAFASGSNGLAATELALAVASTVATLYLLWLVWLALGQYRAWWAGEAQLFDLVWLLLRGALLVLLVSYFVRP